MPPPSALPGTGGSRELCPPRGLCPAGPQAAPRGDTQPGERRARRAPARPRPRSGHAGAYIHVSPPDIVPAGGQRDSGQRAAGSAPGPAAPPLRRKHPTSRPSRSYRASLVAAHPYTPLLRSLLRLVCFFGFIFNIGVYARCCSRVESTGRSAGGCLGFSPDDAMQSVKIQRTNASVPPSRVRALYPCSGG